MENRWKNANGSMKTRWKLWKLWNPSTTNIVVDSVGNRKYLFSTLVEAVSISTNKRSSKNNQFLLIIAKKDSGVVLEAASTPCEVGIQPVSPVDPTSVLPNELPRQASGTEKTCATEKA